MTFMNDYIHAHTHAHTYTPRRYLVETLNDMSHVDPWRTVCVDLMKEIVTEELQHVPVASF